MLYICDKLALFASCKWMPMTPSISLMVFAILNAKLLKKNIVNGRKGSEWDMYSVKS